MYLQRLKMLASTVAFMLCETVLRKPLIKISHHLVARDLGNNRSGTDGGNRLVTLHYSLAGKLPLAHSEIRQPVPVDQNPLW